MHKRILVVVDDRPVTQSAIRQAIELAQAIRADIHFYCVLPAPSVLGFDILPAADLAYDDFQSAAAKHAQKILAFARHWAERAGIQSFCAIGSASDGAQCVSDVATKKHCSLIVVGAEAKNAVFQYLNGSIVPGLIAVASIPVLLCRDSDSGGGFGHREGVSVRERQRSRESLERRRREKND